MSKNYCIILLLLAAGCTGRQSASIAPAAPTVVRDTVRTVSYVTDSSALRVAAKYYQRERTAKDSVYAQKQYVYLKEILKLDSAMAVMRDSLATLKDENRGITAEIAKLQAAEAEPALPEPDSINDMRTRAEWLLAQERKIFTIGAEDNVNDVEVTHVYADAGKIYVAIRTREAAQATAVMNGEHSLLAYRQDNAQVFVFTVPQADKVEINFTLNERLYRVQTTLKTLLGKAIK